MNVKNGVNTNVSGSSFLRKLLHSVLTKDTLLKSAVFDCD